MAKIRSFIAISLPESVLRAIGKVQDTMGSSGLDIRWVRKEGIHLTLKFLGDIDSSDVDKIRSALEQGVKGFAPFLLKGEGVGVFPNLRRPRVVWAGISGDVQVLSALQGNLNAQLREVGFPKEKRRFKGHLTVGRVKGRLDSAKFRAALEEFGGFETESFEVQSVVLFQSTLQPQGAIYTKLAEIGLTAK